MKEQEYVVDALVVLDGENGGFFSYMNYDEAQRIQQCGLASAGQVLLKETTDRKIPDTLKNGITEICDVWVRLEPNISYSLN